MEATEGKFYNIKVQELKGKKRAGKGGLLGLIFLMDLLRFITLVQTYVNID